MVSAELSLWGNEKATRLTTHMAVRAIVLPRWDVCVMWSESVVIHSPGKYLSYERGPVALCLWRQWSERASIQAEHSGDIYLESPATRPKMFLGCTAIHRSIAIGDRCRAWWKQSARCRFMRHPWVPGVSITGQFFEEIVGCSGIEGLMTVGFVVGAGLAEEFAVASVGISAVGPWMYSV